MFLGDFAGGMAARCAWHAGVPQARLGRLVGKWLWLGTKGAVCRGNIFSRFEEATPAKFGAKWSRDCDHFGKKVPGFASLPVSFSCKIGAVQKFQTSHFTRWICGSNPQEMTDHIKAKDSSDFRVPTEGQQGVTVSPPGQVAGFGSNSKGRWKQVETEWKPSIQFHRENHAPGVAHFHGLFRQCCRI